MCIFVILWHFMHPLALCSGMQSCNIQWHLACQTVSPSIVLNVRNASTACILMYHQSEGDIGGFINYCLFVPARHFMYWLLVHLLLVRVPPDAVLLSVRVPFYLFRSWWVGINLMVPLIWLTDTCMFRVNDTNNVRCIIHDGSFWATGLLAERKWNYNISVINAAM